MVETFLNREKPASFEELVIAKSNEFVQDNNLGLVKRLIKTYRQPLRIRMVELSDTYLTLKLNEIDTSSYFIGESHHQAVAKPVHLDGAGLQKVLTEMIADGQIEAKIDQKQKMISFVDKESEDTKGAGNAEYLEVVEELERQNKRIIELMDQVQTVDTNIRQSKQFIKRELNVNN